MSEVKELTKAKLKELLTDTIVDRESLVSDTNTVVTPGYYRCSNTTANTPINAWAMMEVAKAGDVKKQTLWNLTTINLRIFVRITTAADFSGVSWRELSLVPLT